MPTGNGVYAQSSKVTRAYKTLGLDPAVVARAYPITPLIKKLRGGWEEALAAIRASNSDASIHFLRKWDDRDTRQFHRDLLPVEAFCVYAGVHPFALWEAIVVSLTRVNANEGAYIAAINHPAVVRRSVEEALKPDGHSDREWQLKHAGFLPQPKGNVINVQASATAAAASQSAALATTSPPPEQTIRRLTDRFNDLRASDVPALPAATVPALPAATESAPTVLDAMRASQRMGEPAYIEADGEE